MTSHPPDHRRGARGGPPCRASPRPLMAPLAGRLWLDLFVHLLAAVPRPPPPSIPLQSPSSPVVSRWRPRFLHCRAVFTAGAGGGTALWPLLARGDNRHHDAALCLGNVMTPEPSRAKVELAGAGALPGGGGEGGHGTMVTTSSRFCYGVATAPSRHRHRTVTLMSRCDTPA